MSHPANPYQRLIDAMNDVTRKRTGVYVYIINEKGKERNEQSACNHNLPLVGGVGVSNGTVTPSQQLPESLQE